MSSRVSRIPALDGIRAVAIALVLIGHAGEDGLSTRFAPLVIALSHLGVDVFFVLSGFLITSLLLAEYEKNQRINLKAFYERRIRRIFPAYYVFLVVMGIFSLFHVIQVPFLFWLSNVLFVTDYAWSPGVWWTGHSWSLAVEEQYYLIWPLALALAGMARSKLFAFCAIVIVPFIRIVTYFVAPGEKDRIATMFHTRVDVLLIGSLLALSFAHSNLLKSWPRSRYGATIVIAALIGLVSGIGLEIHLRNAYRFSLEYDVTGFSVATIINYVLVRQDSFLARMLSLRPIVWLGRVSYSVYLWQQPFLNPYNHGIFGRFPISVFAALLLGVASYYLVEKRFFTSKPITCEDIHSIAVDRS